MILDAHCHVWESWPYQPAVPHSESRARAEQLLYEMDANGVAQSVIICARIGDNPRNVDYAFEAAERHAGRFVVFPDLECRWSSDYQTPGAAARLEQALSRWPFIGFTLYLAEKEDGSWLNSTDGSAFFALAAETGLILSLSAMPHQMPAVSVLAERCPTLPILLHHHAFLGPRTSATPDALDLVRALGPVPNVFIKVSGMGNVAGPDDEYPYATLAHIPASLRLSFGADRMVWGSDFPVSRRHMTYRQALAMVTRHGPFTPEELPAVLGGTMQELLARRGSP